MAESARFKLVEGYISGMGLLVVGLYKYISVDLPCKVNPHEYQLRPCNVLFGLGSGCQAFKTYAWR